MYTPYPFTQQIGSTSILGLAWDSVYTYCVYRIEIESICKLRLIVAKLQYFWKLRGDLGSYHQTLFFMWGLDLGMPEGLDTQVTSTGMTTDEAMTAICSIKVVWPFLVTVYWLTVTASSFTQVSSNIFTLWVGMVASSLTYKCVYIYNSHAQLIFASHVEAGW